MKCVSLADLKLLQLSKDLLIDLARSTVALYSGSPINDLSHTPYSPYYYRPRLMPFSRSRCIMLRRERGREREREREWVCQEKTIRLSCFMFSSDRSPQECYWLSGSWRRSVSVVTLTCDKTRDLWRQQRRIHTRDPSFSNPYKCVESVNTMMFYQGC